MNTIPVTLACINCVDPELAAAAMQSGDSLPFACRRLLSHAKPDNLPRNIEWVQIPRIATIRDYSCFTLHELHRYIETPHVLTVQADGFILRPELWRDAWLDYDYIGAPWPLATSRHKSQVGNSGFCLRSKRALQLGKEIATRNGWTTVQTTPDGYWDWADDLFLCVACYDEAVARGIRFATLDVAARFSFEQPVENCPQSIGTVFGFHGRLTDQTRHLCDCLFRRVNGGKLRLVVNYYNDRHYPRAIEIDECLRANCGPGLFDEVVALTAADTRMPCYRRVIRTWHEGRPTFSNHFEAAGERRKRPT